ncbi:MAG: AI-2E family transporter [Clostridia bacterium]|nr:AI-2E family transporter [Clostridia bacterium]
MDIYSISGVSMLMDENAKKTILRVLLYFILAFTIYIVGKYLKFIFLPVFIAGIISYILNPLVCFIDKYVKSRTISVIILFSAFIIILVLMVIFIVPKFYEDLSELFVVVPEYIERYKRVVDNFQNYLDSSHMPMMLKDVINTNIQMIGNIIFRYFKSFNKTILNLFSQMLDIIIIPVLSFYFLKDMNYFKNKTVEILPLKYKKTIIGILKDINIVLAKFVRGQFIIALIIALMSTVGLYLLNIRYALLLGTLAGMFDVIPYFGPVIGAIPAILLAALESPSKIFSVIIVFIIIQQVESGIITPKIIGDSMELHPIVVIISLLIAGKFFGILGMLIAVPIVATLRVIFNHLYKALV